MEPGNTRFRAKQSIEIGDLSPKRPLQAPGGVRRIGRPVAWVRVKGSIMQICLKANALLFGLLVLVTAAAGVAQPITGLEVAELSTFGASRFAAFTNVSSAYWRWKASPSIRGSESLNQVDLDQISVALGRLIGRIPRSHVTWISWPCLSVDDLRQGFR